MRALQHPVHRGGPYAEPSPAGKHCALHAFTAHFSHQTPPPKTRRKPTGTVGRRDHGRRPEMTIKSLISAIAAGMAALAVTTAIPAAGQAADVKITPLGSHEGDFCPVRPRPDPGRPGRHAPAVRSGPHGGRRQGPAPGQDRRHPGQAICTATMRGTAICPSPVPAPAPNPR